ncbi:hypothetical protein [Dyadobacter psychrotolerans]|uniref:hypothetical protein n=1 Tax=Dyadobacter psychrotolerans TaxID=2541721 RepID=UPI0014051159|nr:hypothetical protein [Dyadobacter psychrotolerans]
MRSISDAIAKTMAITLLWIESSSYHASFTVWIRIPFCMAIDMISITSSMDLASPETHSAKSHLLF